MPMASNLFSYIIDMDFNHGKISDFILLIDTFQNIVMVSLGMVLTKVMVLQEVVATQ